MAPGLALIPMTEALLLCPSDVPLNNFLWDPVTKQVWVIDCQHVNVFPQSFASFYFHCNTDLFVEVVAEKIDFPVSSQFALLESAAVIVMQSGGSSFG